MPTAIIAIRYAYMYMYSSIMIWNMHSCTHAVFVQHISKQARACDFFKSGLIHETMYTEAGVFYFYFYFYF